MNDRLLLGLKGTMSEYELNLLRQRGLAARDSKAGRGALRFMLPPGLVWSEDGRIELDPDERVQEVIRLVFAKFQELGSARQVFLWIRDAALQLPVVRRNGVVRRIEWRRPAYHSVVQVLHNPLYAGAYAFGRKGERTRIVDGRAVKTTGHTKPMTDWNVLIRDHHEGYIDWERFVQNQRMLLENVDTVRIDDQGAGQIDQMMPVAPVARQPRGVDTEYRADDTSAELSDQALEAGARREAGPRAAKVVVDHGHRREAGGARGISEAY
jgi:hypothetical protein